jgi:hypothetical protein
MGKRKNKKYNNNFKLRAVKLCLETDKSNAEIARDLGVQQTTLSTWKQKYLINQLQAFSDTNSPEPFNQWQIGRMKQCACGQGNMVLTLRAPVRFPGGNIAGFFASTTRTIKAIRPLNIKKRFRTRFLGSIFFFQASKDISGISMAYSLSSTANHFISFKHP